MSAAAVDGWTPRQRAVLAELGLIVYRRAGATVASAPGPAPAPVAEAGEAAVDPAMLARLARAAGLTPAQLQARAPGLAAASAGLAGDAVAKRALWPALRRLRAGRAPG